MKSSKNLAQSIGLTLFLGMASTEVMGQNGLYHQIYTGIFPSNINSLTNNPAFPNNPTQTGVLAAFEAPGSVFDNFGQRVSGFLVPPVTGNYLFWIASDDASALYLSRNENPAQKVAIANVNGFTNPRDWFAEPNQRSAPIFLEAGKRYFIEALAVDGGGGDHVSVRWQLPDGTIEEPIPGNRVLVELIGPQIFEAPQNVRVTERDPATFSVSVSNLGPVQYQWTREGQVIEGATEASYTVESTSLSDNGARFRVVVSNLFGTVTSAPARLNVDPDDVAPELVGAANYGDPGLVTLTFSEGINGATAGDVSHYSLTPAVAVLEARLDPEGSTVVLVTEPLSEGVVYTVEVSGLTDLAASPNELAPNSLAEFEVGFRPLNVSLVKGRAEKIGPSTRRTGLVLSEIMYHPAAREDGRNLEFVEIHNSQSEIVDLGGYRLRGSVDFDFPEGAFIAPKGYVVVGASPEDMEVVYGLNRVYGPYEGDLGNGNGTVRLENNLKAVLLEVAYSQNAPWPAAADGTGHSLTLWRPSYGEADPAAWSWNEVVGGTPGRAELALANPYATVTINEFLAHTDDPELDYLELYNYGEGEIDLSGCALSDSRTEIGYVFPEGTILAGKGFLSLDQTQLGFALDSRGESLFLWDPERTRVIDAVRFGAQENGRASGRSPDGHGAIRALSAKTPGSPNGTPWVSPIVISEIMYHPISGDDNDEYVELHNRSNATVSLSGWRFTAGIAYTFPEGVSLGAGEFLVVARNGQQLISNYSHLNVGNTLGNYQGQLSNSGERVALSRPEVVTFLNEAMETVTETVYILEDEVHYRDGGKWGKWSDGGGSSLELKDAFSDNDFGANWADSDESGKSSWVSIEHTGVLDLGNTNALADSLHVLMLGAGSALIDHVSVVNSTNQLELVENTGFAMGSTGWSALGNHARSEWSEEGDGDAGSYRLVAADRGDTAANRAQTILKRVIPEGATATLKARARWLQGHPEVLLRLRGNYLEASGALEAPKNLGSPGLPNGIWGVNTGPVIVGVKHEPILPAANRNVQVIAEVADPDRIGRLILKYRLDPDTNQVSVVMVYRGAGHYSGEIPGQATDQMVAFSIEASDANGGHSAFPSDAPAREGQILFGQSKPEGELGVYRFWATDQTVEAWSSRPRSTNEELDVTFVYNEDRVIYNLGADYSGSPFHWPSYNSPQGAQCNYVLQAPKDDLFLGETDAVLNLPANIGSDNTAIREQLFFWMVQEMGGRANYRRFHHMYFNGLRRGTANSGFLFEDSQQPNREMVQQWFPNDSDGELYKIEDWFEFAHDGVSGRLNQDASLEPFETTNGERKIARYRWNWRKRGVEGSASDYDSLMELVDAVIVPTEQEYVEAVEELVDIEQWMRAMALLHIVGEWDSYGYRRGKNMYAYKPENGKWVLFHWDIAFSFGNGDGPTTDLFWVNYGNGQPHPAVSRMYQTPAFRRAYWRALKEAVEGPFNPARINPVMDAKFAGLVSNKVAINTPDAQIKGWVEARRSYILAQLANVSANFGLTSPSGDTFSTTRNGITLTGSAPVEVSHIRVNGEDYPVRWTGDNTWQLDYVLTERNNHLVIEGVGLNGAVIGTAKDEIDVEFRGGAESPVGQVVIQEIMYHSPISGGDFIEIHNRSTRSSFDLSGYRVNGVDYTFPSGSVIAPGGFWVLAENRTGFASAYGGGIPVRGVYNGRLDNGGETLSLVAPGADGEERVIDEVRYDNEAPWPAEADGLGGSLQLVNAALDNGRVGNWIAVNNLSTPGQANTPSGVTEELAPLWLNEIVAENRQGITDSAGDHDAWVEALHSGTGARSLSGVTLTDDLAEPAKWGFGDDAELSGYGLVWLDGEEGEGSVGEWHANFVAGNPSGVIYLMGQRQGRPVVLDYLRYENLVADHSYGSTPDAQAVRRQAMFYTTPGAANDGRSAPVQVKINEWMASNLGAVVDPADGDFDDWFELYNPGTESVDLSRYTLSDDPMNVGKYRIPNGTLISAGGFLMVWADEEQGQSSDEALHVNFRLSAAGEEILLSNPEGGLVDRVMFGEQAANVSEGRRPDGADGAFVRFEEATPGRSNSGLPPVGTIVILSIEAVGGNVTLVWSSEAGVTYDVEGKDSLEEPTWRSLGQVMANGETASYTDAVGANPIRFYRIRKN